MPRGSLGEFRSCAGGVAIQKDANIVITVGIIGCGFVGGALKDWLEKNNKDVKIVRFINKHPELEDTKLFVEMRKGSPVDAIKTACDAVSAYFSECKAE